MKLHVIRVESRDQVAGNATVQRYRAVCVCGWTMHEWVRSRDAAATVGHLHMLAHA